MEQEDGESKGKCQVHLIMHTAVRHSPISQPGKLKVGEVKGGLYYSFLLDSWVPRRRNRFIFYKCIHSSTHTSNTHSSSLSCLSSDLFNFLVVFFILPSKVNRVGLCSLRTCHRRIAIAILDSNDKKEQQQQTINDVLLFSFLFPFWQVAVSWHSTSARTPCRHRTTCTTSKHSTGFVNCSPTRYAHLFHVPPLMI